MIFWGLKRTSTENHNSSVEEDDESMGGYRGDINEHLEADEPFKLHQLHSLSLLLGSLRRPILECLSWAHSQCYIVATGGWILTSRAP